MPLGAPTRLTDTPPPPAIGGPRGVGRGCFGPISGRHRTANGHCALASRAGDPAAAQCKPSLTQGPGRYRDEGSQASRHSLGPASGRRERGRRSASNRSRPRPTFSCGVCTSRLSLNLEGTSQARPPPPSDRKAGLRARWGTRKSLSSPLPQSIRSSLGPFHEPLWTSGFRPLSLAPLPPASKEALRRGPETRAGSPARREKHQNKGGTGSGGWENLCWRPRGPRLCSGSPRRRSSWQQDAPSSAPQGGHWPRAGGKRRSPWVFIGSSCSSACRSLNTHTNTPFRWTGQST